MELNERPVRHKIQIVLHYSLAFRKFGLSLRKGSLLWPLQCSDATSWLHFRRFKIYSFEKGLGCEIGEMTKFSEFFSKGGGLFLRGGEMVSHGDSTVK